MKFWRQEKKDDWYRSGLQNLLFSIDPREQKGNKTMDKLVQLIQLLAQKEDSK